MNFSRSDRRHGYLFACSLAAVMLVAARADADTSDHWPISGGMLKMTSSPSDPQGDTFQFKSTKQINIRKDTITEDPTVERSSLIVRGSGVSAGSSDLIHLDPQHWSVIGPADAPKGWKYRGDPIYNSHEGGISSIIIKAGKDSGTLKIKAKGYYWPYDILGSQDSVQVVLTLGGFVYCAEFSSARDADFKTNLEGEVEATGSTPPPDCPVVCGNGVLETGEECDDANTNTNDTCSNECIGCNPADVQYSSTFDGIQTLIFDAYGCSNDTCHGTAQQGGLDLRAGHAYASLVGVPSQIDPNTQRVFAGDQDLSVLYLKLAAATTPGYTPTIGGTPMPFTGSAITSDQLEAIKLWIRGGASDTAVVAGTAELLGSCLPPPTPLNIPQPPAPDPTVGTQIAMPGYTLVPGEQEGCVASYYDISASVPDADLVDCPGAFPGTNDTGYRAGKCFSYNDNELWQDPQSHHSIVHIYPGTYAPSDAGWGGWSCYNGPTPGAACDPTGAADQCGDGGICGSHFHKGVACLPTLAEPHWGAPDFDAATSPQFSGAQEATANFAFPDGVYSLLPLKGLVVWNSHAFNLTSQSTEMNAWINFAYTADRSWPAQGLFASQWIFTQNVAPFHQQEYCATHTFAEGTHLFSLSSHNHKRGIRFRYYDTPQPPPNVAGPCYAPGGTANPSCTPSGTMFFESYVYSDPVVMQFDPPKVFSGTAEERTVKFCALYDNGFTDPSTVKRQSTSPQPTGNLPVGGPCSNSVAQCLGGANQGTLCNGNDAVCGAGGVCDACPLKGGVTTEDEMFIALGTYYVAP